MIIWLLLLFIMIHIRVYYHNVVEKFDLMSHVISNYILYYY
jgi:hypothetical protein